MTNSPAVAALLREAHCHGGRKHEQLLGGKAGPCQEYPKKFCRLICEGIKREIDTAKWRDKVCQAYDISRAFNKLMPAQDKMEKAYNAPEGARLSNCTTAPSS